MYYKIRRQICLTPYLAWLWHKCFYSIEIKESMLCDKRFPVTQQQEQTDKTMTQKENEKLTLIYAQSPTCVHKSLERAPMIPQRRHLIFEG